MKPAQRLRAVIAPPKNDPLRATDALVDAFAERVAAHVIERMGAGGGGSGGGRHGGADIKQQLLDRSGLAIALGVSVSTIDRLITKGCPFVYVLDSKRFEYEKVMAWLCDQTG